MKKIIVLGVVACFYSLSFAGSSSGFDYHYCTYSLIGIHEVVEQVEPCSRGMQETSPAAYSSWIKIDQANKQAAKINASSNPIKSIYCKDNNGKIQKFSKGPCNGSEVTKPEYDRFVKTQNVNNNYDDQSRSVGNDKLSHEEASAQWEKSNGTTQSNSGKNTSKLSDRHTGEYADGTLTNGRAKAGDTEIVNMTAEMTKSRVSDVSTAVVSSAGSREQSRVQQKGANATQNDFVKAETSVAKTNSNALMGSAAVKMVVGGMQVWRAAEHGGSIKELEAKNKQEETENRAAYMRAATAGDQAGMDEALRRNQTREENYKQEKSRQRQIAILQGQIAGGTIAEATNDFMMAANIRKAAKAAEDLQNQNNGTANYAFNPGTTGNEGNLPPPNLEAITTDGAVVTSNTNEDSAGFDDNSDPFAPENLDPGATGAPAPGGFANAAPGMPGNSGSTGMSGAGGTSKASADGENKSQEASAKSQAGGNYASEQNGYRRQNGGSGSGMNVGKDPNFLDMLKNLLPGNEKEEVAKADLNTQNRDPASDNAAVLPRNANIFDAISKRYDKKLKDNSVSPI